MTKTNIGLIILLALVVVTALWAVYGRTDLPEGLAEWQAVFLSDGQVYFGHLEEQNRNFFRLTEVYYLKYGLEDSAASQNLNLIKLGGEVHGPENMMYIPKTQVLFLENLRPSSGVVKAISKNN